MRVPRRLRYDHIKEVKINQKYRSDILNKIRLSKPYHPVISKFIGNEEEVNGVVDISPVRKTSIELMKRVWMENIKSGEGDRYINAAKNVIESLNIDDYSTIIGLRYMFPDLELPPD